MAEFRTGRFDVVLPGTKNKLATIEVTDDGLIVRELPGFSREPAADELELRDEMLSFTRATEILSRDRVKTPPGFLAGEAPSMFPFETANLDLKGLALRMDRSEVMPPTADMPITHSVSVDVVRGEEHLGRLMVTGHLPFDGSPVKKQLVIANENEPVFRVAE